MSQLKRARSVGPALWVVALMADHATNMTRRLSILFLVLWNLCITAPAQQSHAYGYVFVAPVVVPQSAFTRWNGTFVHVGGGGEALGEHFGLEGELGALKPVTNRNAITTGQATVAATYHFVERSSRRKVGPFLDGGIGLLFARGAAIPIHYAIGTNYWLKSRFGLRFEFRHHLWLFPESGVHFLGFRFGLVFRSR